MQVYSIYFNSNLSHKISGVTNDIDSVQYTLINQKVSKYYHFKSSTASNSLPDLVDFLSLWPNN